MDLVRLSIDSYNFSIFVGQSKAVILTGVGIAQC